MIVNLTFLQFQINPLGIIMIVNFKVNFIASTTIHNGNILEERLYTKMKELQMKENSSQNKYFPIIHQALEIVAIVIIIRVLILRQISFIPIHWQLIISNINFIAKMKLRRMIIERLMELKILLI